MNTQIPLSPVGAKYYAPMELNNRWIDVFYQYIAPLGLSFMSFITYSIHSISFILLRPFKIICRK